MFLVVIVVCYVIAMGGCCWSLICNQKTYRQINELLSRIGAVADPGTYNRLYGQLRIERFYHQHHRRLMTFRDPWAIYPDELANLMRVQA